MKDWDDNYEDGCDDRKSRKEEREFRSRKENSERRKTQERRNAKKERDFLLTESDTEGARPNEEQSLTNDLPISTPKSIASSTMPRADISANNTPVHRERVFSTNTLEFKTVKIDFNGVATIQPLESDYGGRHTYGIKFVFKPVRDFTGYRIVWYNTDKNGRDADLTKAQQYWKEHGGKNNG